MRAALACTDGPAWLKVRSPLLLGNQLLVSLCQRRVEFVPSVASCSWQACRLLHSAWAVRSCPWLLPVCTHTGCWLCSARWQAAFHQRHCLQA